MDFYNQLLAQKLSGGGDSGGGVDPSIIERTATNITADMLKGVTSIGSNAFYDYLSLTNVKIPNNVTSIGSQAFYNCRKLKSVKIPNSVTSIGGQAFEFCFSLVSVEIPNSVTSIDREAFYNCSGLISLTVKAATPPTLGDYAFKYTNAALVIYVPSESVDAYKAANNWSTYADKIQAIPSE